MGLKDLFITPIYLIIFTFLAYAIRPYVTNKQTRKYFIPALWIRFIGAIALGIVYQFYYGGGDTFNYWEHGSRWVYKAFLADPEIGLKLLLKSGPEHLPEYFEYSQHIWYYRDDRSFFIIRLATIFDILTFSTYSATALFFAVFNFSGLWAFFLGVNYLFEPKTKNLAIAILFIPSVVFWGSGLLKDTITLGALGWLTWALLRMIESKKSGILEILALTLSSFMIYKIKTYILICFFPLVAFWLLLKNLKKIKNAVLKLLLVPFLIILFGGIGALALTQITAENEAYQLSNIAQQAKTTAYDIRYGWGARTGGDGGYDIGLPDGTIAGTLKLMPAAINVSLFRPYLWEVKNPFMLLSALESLIVLILTIRFILRGGFKKIRTSPFLMFALSFSLLFAFAVGVSTFNFGTLMRYKIPMMPFLAIFLFQDSEALKNSVKNEA